MMVEDILLEFLDELSVSIIKEYLKPIRHDCYDCDEPYGYEGYEYRDAITHLLHNDDGPAEVTSSSHEYYYYGLRHRDDGPAIHIYDTSNLWYKYGQLHREDGPAVEVYANGLGYISYGVWKTIGIRKLIGDDIQIIQWWINGCRRDIKYGPITFLFYFL